MKRPTSLTFRLTFFFAITSAFVLLTLSWITTLSINEHFLIQDRTVLEEKAKSISEIILKSTDKIPLNDIPHHLTSIFIGHNDLFISLISTNGKYRYNSPNIKTPPNLLNKKISNQEQLISWTNNGDSYRSIKNNISLKNTDFYLIVSLKTNNHTLFMYNFQKSLFFYTLIATITSGLLGFFAVKRALSPLYKMKEQALSITINQLSRRMPSTSIPVELSILAKALNQMLDNLEESFKRLSDFSSDIAHELRTPISNISTQTQVALSKPRNAETYRNVLLSNAEEHETISRMITDMLFLAKADNGLIQPFSEKILLEEQADDILEFYEAIADEKNILLSSSGHGIITGDRLMIRRAINNLLSNAIRHTPKNGSIEITITRKEDTIELSVSNTGIKIPDADINHLFDRFYRAEKSRTKKNYDGVGLGLAITKAIIQSHSGTISVTSDDNRTTFNILFPYRDLGTL